MSGKHLVENLRAGGLTPPPPSGPGLGGLLFAAVCVFVIAGSGFYLAARFLRAEPMATAAAVAVVSPAATVDLAARDWTVEDEAACVAAGAAAALAEETALEEEQRNGAGLLPASSMGLAERGAYMVCAMTTKVARLCDPVHRQQLAAIIDKYAAKLESISHSFNSNMATFKSPMLLAATGGHEFPAENFFKEGFDRSFERMVAVHVDVTEAFRGLVVAGLLGPGDFDVFLGYGVTPTIEAMIGDTAATHSICG